MPCIVGDRKRIRCRSVCHYKNQLDVWCVQSSWVYTAEKFRTTSIHMSRHASAQRSMSSRVTSTSFVVFRLFSTNDSGVFFSTKKNTTLTLSSPVNYNRTDVLTSFNWTGHAITIMPSVVWPTVTQIIIIIKSQQSHPACDQYTILLLWLDETIHTI